MAIPTFLQKLAKTPQILHGFWTVLLKKAGLIPKKDLFLPFCNAVLTLPLQGKSGQN